MSKTKEVKPVSPAEQKISDLQMRLLDVERQLVALQVNDDDSDSTDVEAIISRSQEIVLRRGALERVRNVLRSQITQAHAELLEEIRRYRQSEIDQLRAHWDPALEKIKDDLFEIYGRLLALQPIENRLDDLYNLTQTSKGQVGFSLEALFIKGKLENALWTIDGFKFSPHSIQTNNGLSLVYVGERVKALSEESRSRSEESALLSGRMNRTFAKRNNSIESNDEWSA